MQRGAARHFCFLEVYFHITKYAKSLRTLHSVSDTEVLHKGKTNKMKRQKMFFMLLSTLALGSCGAVRPSLGRQACPEDWGTVGKPIWCAAPPPQHS